VRRLYRRFDMVFAPSRHIYSSLQQLGIERVTLQPLGVDTRLFHPARRDAAWRTEHGIAASARVLLYVGRYAAEKNLHILIDAVAKLGDPYVLVMIGGGPIVPSGERVKVLPFEGNMAELTRAYASADAFVHAGDQETFGLAVLEALASGLPTIGCNLGGIAELVDQSVGFAVDTLDSGAFSEAIDALFRRDLSELSGNARARALCYDWDAIFASLEGHYRALLNDHHIRSCDTLEAA
jgi:alpha-1,6-mannosyltransferase